jgi:heterodisulfide reductase subunit C
MNNNISFLDEVAATPGGSKIRSCIQCGMCTGTCPAANEMEYPPRKTIAMIRAGMRDEVLSSNSMALRLLLPLLRPLSPWCQAD